MIRVKAAIQYRWFDGWGVKSYSQEGEDAILNSLFRGQKHGYYVDVGAFHPDRFSNTKLFYQRGWHGINVDAAPGSMASFVRHRKRDINLEIPVHSDPRPIRFHIFDEPALNTFDPVRANSLQRQPSRAYELIRTLDLCPQTLEQILDRHLPKDTRIDFLSVDAEQSDLEVLRSNNWEKYRPRVVVTEVLNSELLSLADDPIVRYMTSQDYQPIAKTNRSVFFNDAEPRR